MTNRKQEIWKPVAGYEGKYEVSNLGRVRRIASGKILKPRPNRTGYLRVVLFDGKRGRNTRMIHHIVLESFVGPRPSGCLGRHLNDIKTDNQVFNLSWGTPQENWEDRRLNGRVNPTKGEEHHNAKLTKETVAKIREEYAPRKTGAQKLAKKYGVSKTAINNILSGRTWNHV